MSVLRSERPSNAPSSSGPRAKALRPFEVRESTRAALYAYERAAQDYESMRLAGDLGEGADRALQANGNAPFLRAAASTLLTALCREHESGTLPRRLADDVERWMDGEFAGSDVDVEVANHAIYALLGSDVCAELIDAA